MTCKPLVPSVVVMAALKLLWVLALLLLCNVAAQPPPPPPLPDAGLSFLRGSSPAGRRHRHRPQPPITFLHPPFQDPATRFRPSPPPPADPAPAPSPGDGEESDGPWEIPPPTAGQDLSPPPPPPPPPPSSMGVSAPQAGSSHRLSRWMVAVMAGVGSGVAFLASFAIVAVCRVSGKENAAAVRPWKQGMSGQMQKAFVTAIPAISRAEVEAACEDFSNIIGSSPDSIVFKGTLDNGTEIAVTSIRISGDSWTSKSEIFFRLKVESLARMSHTHLVNLVSYCSEEEPFARMLIFEYASNGTLFEHLHRKESEHLSWAIRMRIIMGTAYGLQYMHHELEHPVSHANFDSSAVYLTEDYSAKLAEFGFSRSAVVKSDRRRFGSKSHNRMDYDDTEGSDRHAQDFEGNVYSFGVFLLEVVTARLPYSEKEGSLVDWAAPYISDPDRLASMVDPNLEAFDRAQLVSVCQVSRMCTNSSAQRRISMKEATKLLETTLNMTREIAAPKGSLLWAQLEILTSA